MEKLTIALLCMAVIVCAIPITSAGPLADYGDAPDNTSLTVYAYPGVEGQFPSLYDTANTRISGRTGVHHLTTTEEWLNETSAVSTTTKETDALITDFDFDDSDAEVIYDDSTGPPYKAFAIIPVHVASTAPDTTRYLNVLIDQNRDGTWKNTTSATPEWVVINKAINVSPGTALITLSEFLLNTTESSWMRVTLTRTPINESLFSSVGGWDGSAPSGGFAYGETEDYLITPSVNVSVHPGKGKCIIKVIGFGPIDGRCPVCGAPGKVVGGTWTNFHVRIRVVRGGPAPAPPANRVKVVIGPAREVHGKGDFELDTSKPAPGVVIPRAGLMWAIDQSGPQRYPEPGALGVVWQDVGFRVDAGGNCIQGDTADVVFRAKFPAPGRDRHWKANVKRELFDPDSVYVESDDHIIADFGEPMVESSDSSGKKKDTFLEGDEVYAYGGWYNPDKTYDLYIVEDRTWTNGMPIGTYKIKTTVSTDADGKISPHPTLIWSSTVIGEYDIIVDVNGNGNYDEGIDPLDDMDVNNAGFETIPEFTTIAIPVAAILGLLFLFSRRKRKE